MSDNVEFSSESKFTSQTACCEDSPFSTEHPPSSVAHDLHESGEDLKSGSDAQPQTPVSELDYDAIFPKPALQFKSIDDLEIPYVREIGVKQCIETLGNFFEITNYRFDLLEFWILDSITNCLWTAQDEFRLPPDAQKIVLSWFLYFLDLLRGKTLSTLKITISVVDPTKNLSRKQFFETFKEAIFVAADVIAEGGDAVPSPEKLFVLVEDGAKSEKSSKTTSSDNCSSLEVTEADSVTYVKAENDSQYYKLPKEVCSCFEYDLSSIVTTQEASNFELSAVSKFQEESEEDLQSYFDFRSLYKTDDNMPKRFLPLPEESIQADVQSDSPTFCKSSSVEDISEIVAVELQDAYKITTGTVFSKSTSESDSVNPISMPSTSSVTKLSSDTKLKKEALQRLAAQKMWEQRFLDMQDPRRGWLPYDTSSDDSNEDEASDVQGDYEVSENDEKWISEYLTKNKQGIEEMEDRQMYNFGILWAIVEYVIKNFYESFQFHLIRLAFQSTPSFITKRLNKEWQVPKRTKGGFQRPKFVKVKPTKEKEEKIKPEKQEQPEKEKSEKKEKPPKETKAPKLKPSIPTKEEKEEMERLKREQMLIEEEQMRLEDNKRFVFPLGDAATDELFQSMFENWVKVDLNNKGKRDKK